MLIAVARTGPNAGTLLRLDTDEPAAPSDHRGPTGHPDPINHPTPSDHPAPTIDLATTTDDLATTVGRVEAEHHPRWVWADTGAIYRDLVAAGVRVQRSHDLTMAERALLGYAGRWGEPASVPAAWARARGQAPPEEPPVSEPTQPTLFSTTERLPLEAIARVHREQVNAIAHPHGPEAVEPRTIGPRQLDLLITADSAGELAATEMSHVGLPWRTDIHDRLLAEALGPRPRHGGRPAKLQDLAEEIANALHAPHLNPDSPAELLRAFSRDGVILPSTRAHVLKQIEHPAIEPLLRYKALSRLHTANGWAWLASWVRDGRFRPEYVAAAVVSGRWATRGGGALQIPHSVRSAVVADPGWVLLAADAQQLEPRVLAALSGDRAMGEAARHGDLYAALAEQSFNGDRKAAKVGLISAMYGGASPATAILRRRYPQALALLERAARAGEAGGLVRSALGRTCPPGAAGWDGLSEDQSVRRARDRGRFTRNFIIQASAADWAAVMLAMLRRRLESTAAELVFFCHDEVIVHAPAEDAERAADDIVQAAAEATRLVLGDVVAPLPLTPSAVACYAEAK
jgi:DNA polymerase-1